MLPVDNKSGSGNIKLFEYVRVRPAKRKEILNNNEDISTSKYASSNGHFLGNLSQELINDLESQKIPKKRSGHRAVCNEDYLWIWGGYCPGIK